MTEKPKNGTIEYRYMERSAGVPKLENGNLSGRAAPFNTQTMIGKKPWGFRESIAPGAFKKSINDGDVVLLDNHDTAKPISRQSAGTLKLNETKGGLDWDAVPANTSYANDVRENAKAGNYGGCSFGFEVIRDSWHYNKEDDVDERTLHEVKLHEISVVTFPAYTDGTTVSARDQVEAAQEARDRYYMREYFELYVEGGIDSEESGNRGGNAPGNGKKPYGNVTYADPGYQQDGKKRYPIDTKAHAKSAWSYINKASNASAYTSQQLSSIKSKIKSALKKFGVKVSGGKNSAEFNAEERETVKATSKKTAADIAVKSVKRSVALHRDLVRVCLDSDIDDSAIRAHVLAVLANSRVNDLEKVSKRLNKVGNSVVVDDDGDDPICKACNGSGKFEDGVADCPGCGGVGRVAGPGSEAEPGDGHQGGTPGNSQGDDKGDHKDYTNGLGTGSPVGSSDQSNSNGDGNPGGDDNSGILGSNKGPQVGKGSKDLSNQGGSVKLPGQLNSEDFDGETREDGQPDTSTDLDEDDATRWLKAKARQRREQFESA